VSLLTLFTSSDRLCTLVAGAAELLAARGATLLAMLVECEQPSFLDSVAQHPASHATARQIVARLAQNIGELRPRARGGHRVREPACDLTPHLASRQLQAQNPVHSLLGLHLLLDDRCGAASRCLLHDAGMWQTEAGTRVRCLLDIHQVNKLPSVLPPFSDSIAAGVLLC
jgi:hypothetical protein